MALRGLGFASKGLIPTLFVMGVIMFALHVLDPLGAVFMASAGVFVIINIIIYLDKKTSRPKKRW